MPEEKPAAPKRSRWVLLAVLATVFVARLLLAMSRMDEVELEIYSGSLATAILAGLPLDATELPIIVHLRGSYIVGLLLVPLFWLFGSTLWALKVLAIGWSLATAAVLVVLLDRVLGWRAALAGGLVYAFLPPSFVVVDIMILGSHGETILFILLALLFLVTRRRSLLLDRWGSFVFGASIGVGFLFSMQFLPAIPALILAWWAFEARLAGPAEERPKGASAEFGIEHSSVFDEDAAGSAEHEPGAWIRRHRALLESLAIGLPALVGAFAYLKWGAPRVPLAMWWQIALVGLVLTGLACGVRLLRTLAILGGMFVVCSPIAYITRTTELVNRPLSERILENGLPAAAQKFIDGMFVEFGQSWLFEFYAIGGSLGTVLFAAGLLVGLAATLRRALRGQPFALFLVLHPLFFFLMYGMLDLELKLHVPLDGFGSRYVMPVLACVCCWIAIGVHDLWSAGRPRLASAVAGAPVLAGILGLLPMLEPSIAWSQSPMRGDRIHLFGAHFKHAAPKLPERLEWVQHVDPQWAPYRPGYYRETMTSQRFNPGTRDEFEYALYDALRIPGELGAHVLFGLGHRTFELDVVRQSGIAPLLLGVLRIEDPESLDPNGVEPNNVWFARGFGSAGVDAKFLEVVYSEAQGGPLAPFELQPLLASMPPAWRGYALQGAGFVTGDKLTAFNRLPLWQMELCEEELEGDDLHNFFVGLGLGFRTHYHDDEWWVPEPGELRIERMLGPGAQAAFREGLAASHVRFPVPRVSAE